MLPIRKHKQTCQTRSFHKLFIRTAYDNSQIYYTLPYGSYFVVWVLCTLCLAQIHCMFHLAASEQRALFFENLAAFNPRMGKWVCVREIIFLLYGFAPVRCCNRHFKYLFLLNFPVLF